MLNASVTTALLEFRRKRNWEQFHTPKELAAALAIEASELLEVFQMEVGRRSGSSPDGSHKSTGY
jgi:NTP pyrophosphatase (non-canonical NTP hydrolase)